MEYQGGVAGGEGSLDVLALVLAVDKGDGQLVLAEPWVGAGEQEAVGVVGGKVPEEAASAQGVGVRRDESLRKGEEAQEVAGGVAVVKALAEGRAGRRGLGWLQIQKNKISSIFGGGNHLKPPNSMY